MIYVVWAKSCSPRDTLVGYATGHKDDIVAYFADRAEYGLYLQEISIVDVEDGYADKRYRISTQVQHLRETADKLEKELEKPTAT